MSDRKKRVKKEEKQYLDFFYKIYNRFGNPNKDYETRQKELEEAITSNPKKKKKTKNERIALFRRENK